MPVDRETAAKVKGMLARGDEVDNIAVWFGLNAHVVRAVQIAAVHPYIEPARPFTLPPPGPYVHMADAYRALEEVRRGERDLRHLAALVRWNDPGVQTEQPR